MTITTASLQAYFNQRNNRFQNNNGMHFLWSADGYIHTNMIWYGLGHETFDHFDYEMSIITEWDTPETFVEKFGLNDLTDIEVLDAKDSWMRYLNGFAEIIVHPLILEANFHFRIKVFNTIVHSLALHYFDIESSHLTIPDDFIAYFNSREKLISKYCAIRFK